VKCGPQVHRRRSIRLAGYDYSQAGGYFITICSHNRALLLEDERVQHVVRSAWQDLPARFPTIALDEFTVMPNHIHGIILLRGAASSAQTLQGAASSAPTLGRVVRAFKSISAIEANEILHRSGQPFWQRNYYEHIIRDEDELHALRQYIRDNPVNWKTDADNPSNL
jgi:putative transposase